MSRPSKKKKKGGGLGVALLCNRIQEDHCIRETIMIGEGMSV